MATAKRSRAKAARAKAAEAAKADRENAYEAAMAADAEARTAEAKAQEAEEAAKMAAAKAVEAEEAAETARVMAEEATKMAAAKAVEAEEAAATARVMAEEVTKMAAAKAVEAEEAAETARVMAEEAAKAREAVEEMGRLEDKETEWAQCEEELFAYKFSRYWNILYAYRGIRTFLQITTIPAMRYTYPAREDSPKAMETLQIMSVKIAAIKECLHWPLQVFGLVAARDNLDHKRNIIFHRPRNNCQTIAEEDPYLELTGPSRAIAVSVDPSYVEVSLKVKGATKAQDKDLSDLVLQYRTGRFLSGIYPSRLSTLEIAFDHVTRSVEATICIKLTDGSWPIGFVGVVAASTSTRDDLKVKLLDSGDDGLPLDADGAVELSRRVVSVGHVESLNVYVTASRVDDRQVVESSMVSFKAARAGINVSELSLGFCSMNVTVAWSCFRREW